LTLRTASSTTTTSTTTSTTTTGSAEHYGKAAIIKCINKFFTGFRTDPFTNLFYNLLT
jgi:hypothetical protein